jgi:hypothetical protein
MGRTGTIVGVVVASGILIAGSIVSVAAISSSVLEHPEPGALAATTAAALEPTEASEPATTSAPAITAEDLTVTSSDDDLLVPDVIAEPSPAATRVDGIQTTAPVQPATAPSISATSARAIVLRAVHGRVLATWSTSRAGYRVFAIKVVRPDGSVVVGYVDRFTGTVIDWAKLSNGAGTTTSRPASSRPTPRPTTTTSHPTPKPSRTRRASTSPRPQATSTETETPTPTPTPTRTRTHQSWSPTAEPSPSESWSTARPTPTYTPSRDSHGDSSDD